MALAATLENLDSLGYPVSAGDQVSVVLKASLVFLDTLEPQASVGWVCQGSQENKVLKVFKVFPATPVSAELVHLASAVTLVPLVSVALVFQATPASAVSPVLVPQATLVTQASAATQVCWVFKDSQGSPGIQVSLGLLEPEPPASQASVGNPVQALQATQASVELPEHREHLVSLERSALMDLRASPASAVSVSAVTQALVGSRAQALLAFRERPEHLVTLVDQASQELTAYLALLVSVV